MAKFILIDHSIIGLAGHHYEYAVRVLQAAQEAGYSPILATNRKFKMAGSVPWNVFPVYKYGFWFRLTPPAGFQAFKALYDRFKKWTLRQKYKLIFSSPFFYVSLAIYNPREAVLSLGKNLSIKEWIGVAMLAYLFALGRALARFLLSILPFRRYLSNVLGAFRNFLKSIFRPIEILNKYEALHRLFDIRRGQMFAKDTERLFRHLTLEEGDIVFIPTLSEVEMRGLLWYFRKDPRSAKATWHLVFRRNIYLGREPQYQGQEESLRPLRLAFLKFKEALGGQKVFFYTDTEKLTAQYNRLHVAQFRTLPIPVSKEFTRDILDQRSQAKGMPLRVIYAGDARCEKGYQFLPRIVQDLWADYVETGKVVFAFQSNFNIREGEPEVVIARSQLQNFPKDKVTLITDPLSTEDYVNFLLSGDIVLFLYDRDNYYARSAGILAEALAAGIPVIVPAGTWLAEQFIDQIYQYHATLRETVMIIKTVNGANLRWHNFRDLRLNPMSGDLLTFGGEADKAFCWLYPPAFASWLMISFNPATSQPGVFVLVHVGQIADGYSISERDFITGEMCAGRIMSVLVPIEKGVKKIWLGLRNAFDDFPISVSDIRIDFIALKPDQRCPLGAVGLTYVHPEEVSDLIREIVNNYPHYKETARIFSRQWFEKQNAKRLVEELSVSCLRSKKKVMMI